MAERIERIDASVDQWWLWFGVALFLLLPFDLLTTLLAVTKYGLGVEANPIVRWLLGHGILAVAAANLAVVVLGTVLFHAAIRSIRRAPATYHRSLTHVVNAWIGCLLVVGVVVAVNNLLVLVRPGL